MLGSVAAVIPFVSEYLCGRVMWVRNAWRGRLLDVGCGAGDLLLRMKSYGWEVHGVEPDPVAAESLRKYGIDVTEGTLPNKQLQEASFDVITASHVIEHIADPAAFLTACFNLLRPDGHLVVATPNANSAGLRKYSQSWVHLDAPRHLVIFTPEGLAKSLGAARFHTESITTSCRSAFFATKTSRELRRGAMRIGANTKFSLMDKCAAFATFLREGLLPHSQAGQEIVAIGRKSSD